jgi:hypothetical protein
MSTNTVYGLNADKIAQVIGDDVPVPVVPTYAATIALDASVSTYFDIVTTSAIGNATLTVANGKPGQRLTVILNNDATSARTITFSTGFRSNSTVVGTTSKAISILFIYSSTQSAFLEVARSGAAV